MENTKITVGVTCSSCNEEKKVEMTMTQFEELNTDLDKNIQDILPNKTPGERELFISGMCEDCFKGLFNIKDNL